MSNSIRLKHDFFAQHTLRVARDLLGAHLVRVENGQRIAGIIVETEAYRGEDDQACHAHSGLTPRTAAMYGPPGHAYVYFIYGIHWLLNFVTEEKGFPAAVLIRAIHPTEGGEIISQRRDGRPPSEWVNGPAKICQALGINKRHNQADLCAPDAGLFVEQGKRIPDSNVTTAPRVGLNNVPEPWKSIPWRFVVS
ncbi:MAG: DNA-3-methyladenine glycosylase [Chloroflexota bacterium]|nr:DNA-3-methyladenine glycosylase [Chloroflexota bacterium]